MQIKFQKVEKLTFIPHNPYTYLKFEDNEEASRLAQRYKQFIDFVGLIALLHLFSYNILIWGNVEINYAFYVYLAQFMFLLFPYGLYRSIRLFHLAVYRADAQKSLSLLILFLFSVTVLFFFHSLILHLNTLEPFYVNLTIFLSFFLLFIYALRYFKI